MEPSLSDSFEQIHAYAHYSGSPVNVPSNMNLNFRAGDQYNSSVKYINFTRNVHHYTPRAGNVVYSQHYAISYDGNGYYVDKVLDRGAFGIISKVYYQATPEVSYARKQLPLKKVKKEKIQNKVKLLRQASHRHVVEVVDEYQDEE
ncbi:hypothetical protein BKA65DRAFT_475090 [Rhexocercosporidium sp. MPI-PUGE-AT-0058]|nr:hypothetical protein BKA65DRAFT_475090 [Rhexocercosporidium sp. MPI-PUGE-AT-0058]